jgi:putative nucleotidyltransferase with HDIG domain
MAPDTREEADATGDRWRRRPILSWLLSATVLVVPVAVSIISATVTAHLLPGPRGVAPTVAWWSAVLMVPTLVLVGADRLARRALPLAVLLKMTMVFPDRAPKRLAVAKRAGTTRDLARRIEEAKALGIEDEPVLAAEKILALAGALNAHDRKTRGHGERVRAYTDLIADELGLVQQDRDRLRWSALLHDIGKLSVHPHVLNKPDKLSDDEWEVIKRHPLEGARLTAPLAGWLGEWANTIAEHHERFDGNGYPYGLGGQRISLGGRIVAVADSYDTMTAIRSYQRPISPDAARAELAACAGAQFDPRIVRAFLDLSLDRLRPITGPLAWLGSLPFVSNVPRLGQAVTALGRTGLAAATMAGVVAVGAHDITQARSVPHQGAVTFDVGHDQSGGSGSPGALGSSQGTTSSANGLPSGQGDGLRGAPGSTPAAWPSGATANPGQGSGADSTGGSTPTGPSASGSSPGGGAGPASATTTLAPGRGGGSTTTMAGSTTTVVAGQASLRIINGGAQAGRAQLGDQIIVTFSTGPPPGSFCSAWSAGAYPDLVDPNVVVNGLHATGNNQVTLTDASDCVGGFHFGTIDLGQTGYFSGSSTFGGASAQCSTSTRTGCSRIHWDGGRTLTITLGTESSGQPTKTTPSIAVYTPDPALGVSGIISSPSEEHF